MRTNNYKSLFLVFGACTLALFSITHAQQPLSDLENLRTASSTLTAAYEKINLFEAWEKIREDVQDFATRMFGIIIFNKVA